VSGTEAESAAAAPPEPAAWVYILRCADGSLYTGWTSDLRRRLASHNEGRASRYTASRLPVELAFALPMQGRGAAMSAEARIKGLSRAEKLAIVEARAIE
jgi:putative endonuclease